VFCGLFKRNGGFPVDEQLEETTCKVLEGLFFFEILNFEVLPLLGAVVDGPDSFT
jgi:hypothetical protein